MLTPRYGATLTDTGAELRVWAPRAREVVLRWQRQGESEWNEVAMQRAGEDFTATIEAAPGDRYFYRVDEHQPVPDPMSRLLPDGVHGPTAIVDPGFAWTDAEWRGLPLEDYILYELHAGTFSPEATFAGVME